MIHASKDVFCFRFCSTIRCNGQDCELIFRLCCEIILNIFRLFEATPFRPLCAGSSLFQSRSDRHPQVRNRQQNLPRVREPVLGPGESRDNSMIFLFVFLSWMLWSAATLLMPNYLLGIFLGNKFIKWFKSHTKLYPFNREFLFNKLHYSFQDSSSCTPGMRWPRLRSTTARTGSVTSSALTPSSSSPTCSWVGLLVLMPSMVLL